MSDLWPSPEQEQEWADHKNLIHKGEKRVMNNGEICEVVEVYWDFAKYWKRNRPYVRLKLLQDGLVIERSYSTMKTYPLLDDIEI